MSAIKPLLSLAMIGFLFAVGLALGGMTQPSKVIGFFTFWDWDPSLAFVMGGALMVYLPAYFWTVRRGRAPRFDSILRIPSRRDIDARLLGGSAVFGLGWGLIGYCPGPAIASLGTLSAPAVIVVLSMIAGATATHRLGLIRPRGTGERPPVGAKAAPGAQ